MEEANKEVGSDNTNVTGDMRAGYGRGNIGWKGGKGRIIRSPRNSGRKCQPSRGFKDKLEVIGAQEEEQARHRPEGAFAKPARHTWQYWGILLAVLTGEVWFVVTQWSQGCY